MSVPAKIPTKTLVMLAAHSERALSDKAKKRALTTYAARVSKKGSAGQLSVNMSNTLVNAAHRLTLVEKRIMMFAVAKVDSVRVRSHHENLPVYITASDYAKTFGLDMSTAYSELKSGVDKLYERTIGWSSVPGAPGQDSRWIATKKYHKQEGWVEVHINAPILPFLTHLRGQFVSYKLAQASGLRSVYSWRLLELLTQFKRKGWRQDDLTHFVHAMEVTNTTYAKNFAQLRRWVLEPAIKELKEKDGWDISYDAIKAGRKVVALRFEFKRTPQGVLPL